MTTTSKINDNKQKIFAYLRKSTKKAQQEQSIEKQKNAIIDFANFAAIECKNIEYFIDE
jgi:DNA invertase Pin-like site-specific DNA recombinase